MRSDGNPGQTGDRENPSYVRDILCPLSRVELDLRNPSRPAVFDPHQQAGHKTAPDRDAKLQKSSCNAGTIHTGHRAFWPQRLIQLVLVDFAVLNEVPPRQS